MSSAIGEQVQSTKGTRPAWTFTSKPRPAKPSEVPAPGAYEAPSSLGKQVTSAAPTSPIPSFSTSQRVHVDYTKGQPGPGAYRSQTALGQQASSLRKSAPAFSLAGRVSPRNLSKTPGPGDYRDPMLGKHPVKRNAPQYSMVPRRELTPRDPAPGPGEHETAVPATGQQPLSTHPSAPAYSLGVRRFQKTKDEADKLGPGRCRSDGAFGKQPYSVKRSAPVYTFGGRTPLPHSPVTSKNPGPGAHEISSLTTGTQISSRVRTSPAYSLSYRREPPKPKKQPGPGDYENPGGIGKQPDSAHVTAPAFNFGSGVGRRRLPTSQAPGPGTYEIESPIGRREGPVMKGREKFGSHVNHSIAPGPGAYNNSPSGRYAKKKVAPAFRFPGARRSSDYTTCSPGPGAYSSRSSASRKGFSLSGRIARRVVQYEHEGPGRCREDSAFGKQTTSTQRSHGGFTFGTRFKLADRDKTPGPGAYMGFSRGVESVPMGRKLNLTGKRTKKKRRKRVRRKRSTASTSPRAATAEPGQSRGHGRRRSPRGGGLVEGSSRLSARSEY